MEVMPPNLNYSTGIVMEGLRNTTNKSTTVGTLAAIWTGHLPNTRHKRHRLRKPAQYFYLAFLMRTALCSDIHQWSSVGVARDKLISPRLYATLCTASSRDWCSHQVDFHQCWFLGCPGYANQTQTNKQTKDIVTDLAVLRIWTLLLNG
jgi:hypothetical protein